MDKTQYFEISKKEKLPNRCPLLNICRRRAFTIYLFSFWKAYPNSSNLWEELLNKHGILSKGYFDNVIEFLGEEPEMSFGEEYFSFNHVCPEVNLFDSSHKIFSVPTSACTKGDWDKLRTSKKFISYEEKHFSECAEFSNYIFENRIIKASKKYRKSIPQHNKVRAELQKEINSRCPFCNNDDVGHFEIHHIDENPSNNNIVKPYSYL